MSSNNPLRTATLVAEIYDAVLDENRWESVARLLAKEFEAHQALIHLPMLGGELNDSVISFGIDDAIHARYIELIDHDLWLQGMHSLPNMSACKSEQLLGEKAFRASLFYNELCIPSGVSHMGGATIKNTNSWLSCFATQRDHQRGEFTDQELRYMDGLKIHFERAFHIRATLGRLRDEVRDLHDSLDQLSIATFLADERGRINWSNKFADQLVSQSDGISRRNDRLSFHSSIENQTFDKLTKDATSTTLDKGLSPGGRVRITRLSGKPPYQATICPLSRIDGPWGDRATAVIFVIDPDNPSPMSKDAMRTYYGLTEAELRLCGQLLLGRSLKEAAEATEISVNTVRTQIKNIFRKCKVSSQAQLVLKLSRSSMSFGPT